MKKIILKEIIKNCSDKDLSLPTDYTEIFTNIKYNKYYLRGQCIPFNDPFYDYGLEANEPISVGSYVFFIFVLVNDRYQNIMKNSSYDVNYNFGCFVGNTIDKVLKKETYDNITNIQYPDQDSHKFIIYDDDPEKIIQLSIKKEDLEIKETPYLNKLIEEKKDIILLDMDMILYLVDELSTAKNKKLVYPPKIYSYLAFNYSDDWEYAITERKDDHEMLYPHSNIDFIKNLYDILSLDLDYYYLSRKDFLIILKNIGELAWEWIKKKRVTKNYIKYLNKIKSEIGDRDYPFTNFCYKFFDELIKDLLKKKQVLKCHFCDDYIRYQNGKKYCSLKSEGKDCGKKARNKRFYKVHKETILPKARKVTEELRQWYKEEEIKK